MKTEDFDDAIKRKLDRIDPAYSNEDIDRVHQYVIAARSLVIFFKNKQTVFILALTCLLTMLSGLNYYQLRQQRILFDTIDILQKKMSAANSNHNSMPKEDTMFIIKYSDQSAGDVQGEKFKIIKADKSKVIALYESLSRRHVNTNVGQEKLPSGINNRITNQRHQASERNISGVESVNQLQRTNVDKIIPATADQKKVERIAHKENVNNFAAEPGSINSDAYDPEDSRNRPAQDVMSVGQNFPKDAVSYKRLGMDSPVLKEIPMPDTSNSNLLETYPKNSSHKKDTLQHVGLAPARDTLSKAATRESKNNEADVSARNSRYRAGVAMEKANNQLAVSVVGELFLTKKFSISSGFKFLNISKQYDDAIDFSRENNKYASLVHTSSDSSIVSDINTNYSIIQIPVIINYYEPLRNNFSLLFSVGTDVDLSGKLKINYRNLDYFKENFDQQKQVNYTLNTVALNNAVVSFGLEKKWSHLAAQATPFVSPQLKKVDYKNSNVYYGLRVRVLYDF